MKNWEWEQHKGDQDFFNFRKEFVDTLLRKVMYQVKCETPQCTATSVGSVSLYSDYDITVVGPKSAEIVDEFNAQFRAIFGKESATVFDTNVYGAAFVEPIQVGNFSIFTAPPRNFTYVKDAGDEVAQRNWALLKLYTHLQDDNERNQFVVHFPNVPLRMMTSDIKARNMEYVKSLYAVSRLKTLMKTTKTPDFELRRQYKDAISTANFYGAETYFTQGAFMHVVGEIQSNLKQLPITRDEYVDSFIENIGDTLKEKDMDKMSKYFARAMHALLKLYPNSEKFAKLYEAAENLRIKVRNKRVKDVCDPSEVKECVRKATATQLRKNFVLLLGPGRESVLEFFYKNLISFY